jgi:hypothetical protein
MEIMEQAFIWLIENIIGAFFSACFGALLGIGGTSYYFKKNSSVKSRQSLKSGSNSQNIQVNGNMINNDIKTK